MTVSPCLVTSCGMRQKVKSRLEALPKRELTTSAANLPLLVIIQALVILIPICGIIYKRLILNIPLKVKKGYISPVNVSILIEPPVPRKSLSPKLPSENGRIDCKIVYSRSSSHSVKHGSVSFHMYETVKAQSDSLKGSFRSKHQTAMGTESFFTPI